MNYLHINVLLGQAGGMFSHKEKEMEALKTMIGINIIPGLCHCMNAPTCIELLLVR
jgi:hypothetical protein